MYQDSFIRKIVLVEQSLRVIFFIKSLLAHIMTEGFGLLATAIDRLNETSRYEIPKALKTFSHYK